LPSDPSGTFDADEAQSGAPVGAAVAVGGAVGVGLDVTVGLVDWVGAAVAVAVGVDD